MAIVANNKKVSLKGLSWNYSPEEISSKTDELIAKVEEVRSKINSVNVADATCDNVLLPLAYMEAETSALRYYFDLFTVKFKYLFNDLHLFYFSK